MRRNWYELVAAAVSVAGVQLFQHALGALARMPLAVWRTEHEHRKEAGRRREREVLERSCLETIEVAVVELLDSPLWLDDELIFRLSHDELVTIRGLGEYSANGMLRRLRWVVNQGYRVAERLRGSWSAFETATSRCAGVLVDGPAPRLIDDVVVALKETEHAAGELARAQGDAIDAARTPSVDALASAQDERRRRFDGFGGAVERAVGAASELERLADPAAAAARSEAIARSRARRRYTRLAADRAAASAARRIRGDLATAELLDADRRRFLHESPPGQDLSQPVLDLVREVLDTMDRLTGATRRSAGGAELAAAREDLRRAVRAMEEAAERQHGEHEDVRASV